MVEPQDVKSRRFPSPRGDAVLVEAMSAELDVLTDTLTDAIHDHLDELDDDLRLLTHESVRANLELIVTMLREGTPSADAVAPQAALTYVSGYVRRGLGPDLLQRAYRTAQATLSHVVLARLRAMTDDADDLVELASSLNDFLFGWVDALERQITGFYLGEREEWLRGAEAQRADQVRRILEGDRIDVEDVSRDLLYDLSGEHVAYVVWSDEDSDGVIVEMRRMASTIAEALGAKSSLVVQLGRHLTCWSTIQGSRSLGPVLSSPPVPGLHTTLGTPAPGVDGFRLSHREALLARRIARMRRRSSAHTSYSAVALDSLATHDPEEAQRFVERELGPLASEDDAARRMSATLRVFLDESSSFVRTARRLGVHENTVAYRVRRAEAVLGHPIAERRLELGVALRLARLALPGGGDVADAAPR